ncbi:MAG: methyltransferase domain-containing protein [Andreesenia angusta]|nr:methyltransferase domain-containing protein [Andreesenia angusta]
MVSIIKRQILPTFIISWVFWIGLAILTRNGDIEPLKFPGIILLFLGGFTPTIVAIYNYGDIKNIFKYLRNGKIDKKLISIFHIIIFLGALISSKGDIEKSLPILLITWLLMTIVLGGNEELLWRGILLDSFMKKARFIPSNIIIGIIWGFWHLPLFLIEGFNKIPFPFFILSSIALSIILSFIRYRGNIISAMVFHGLINTVFNSFNIVNPFGLLISQLILLIYSIYKAREVDEKDNVWDKVADIYDKILENDRPAYRKIGKNINKLDKNARVLELCSGTGILTEYIYKDFTELESSDYSDEMLRELKTKFSGSNIKISKIDCMNIDREDKTYDIVIIANALHIVPDADLTVKEIRRVLDDSGIFIAATFLRENSLKQRLMNKILKLAGIETYNSWTFKEYKEFFENRNWEIIRSEKIPSKFPIGYLELKKK